MRQGKSIEPGPRRTLQRLVYVFRCTKPSGSLVTRDLTIAFASSWECAHCIRSVCSHRHLPLAFKRCAVQSEARANRLLHSIFAAGWTQMQTFHILSLHCFCGVVILTPLCRPCSVVYYGRHKEVHFWHRCSWLSAHSRLAAGLCLACDFYNHNPKSPACNNMSLAPGIHVMRPAVPLVLLLLVVVRPGACSVAGVYSVGENGAACTKNASGHMQNLVRDRLCLA